MEAALIKVLEARGGNLLLKDINILETKEQHHDWRKKALRWGKDQDLDQPNPAIHPGVRPAINTSQELRDAYEANLATYTAIDTAWRRKQYKSVNSLQSILGEYGQSLIETTVLWDTAMEIIETNFKIIGDSSLLDVLRLCDNMVLAGYASVDAYTEEFNLTYSKLLHKHSIVIAPVLLIHKYITGLGDPFTDWRRSFNQNYVIEGPTAITLKKLQELCAVEDRRMDEDSAATAFYAGRPARSSNVGKGPFPTQPTNYNRPPTSDRWCTNCNTTRHDTDGEFGCWILHPHLKEAYAKKFPDRAAQNKVRNDLRKDERKAKKAATRAVSTRPTRDSSIPNYTMMAQTPTTPNAFSHTTYTQAKANKTAGSRI